MSPGLRRNIRKEGGDSMGRMQYEGARSVERAIAAERAIYATSPSLPLAKLKTMLSEAWTARQDAQEALKNAEKVFDGILAAVFNRMSGMLSTVADLGDMAKFDKCR